MNIEDEVLEKLRRLPAEKKADVLRYVEQVEAAVAGGRLPGAISDRAAASMRWIAAHRAEYAGQWVAMDGDRLVAAGGEARAVADEARRRGVRVPFVHRVEPEEDRPFWGGWL